MSQTTTDNGHVKIPTAELVAVETPADAIPEPAVADVAQYADITAPPELRPVIPEHLANVGRDQVHRPASLRPPLAPHPVPRPPLARLPDQDGHLRAEGLDVPARPGHHLVARDQPVDPRIAGRRPWHARPRRRDESPHARSEDPHRSAGRSSPACAMLAAGILYRDGRLPAVVGMDHRRRRRRAVPRQVRRAPEQADHPRGSSPLPVPDPHARRPSPARWPA